MTIRHLHHGGVGVLLGCLLLVNCSAEAEAGSGATVPLPSATRSSNAPSVDAEKPTWAPSALDPTVLPLANGSDSAAIIAGLVLDPHPNQPATDQRVRVLAPVPIYDGIEGAEVAYLDPVTVWTETTLPIFERAGDWGLVPVFARVGLPSQGVRGQATAWVYLKDPRLETLASEYVISLDGEALTVRRGGEVILTENVGIGAEGTRTPKGRSGLAGIWVDDAAVYTRGHQIIALTRFSDDADTLVPVGAAAGTQAPPLIAVHYHDVHAGTVSNGCIRVSAETTDFLAALPLGTAVLIG